MSLLYRYTIDGNVITETENIQGWDKLVTSIKRDSSTIKGLLVTQDVQLVFVGDMYRYFKNKYFNESICGDVPVIIEQSFDNGNNYSILHRGKIFVSDLKLNLLKGEATVKVQDDSFYARINNNKSITTNIRAGASKNGIAIPACPVYKTTLFTPSTGATIIDGTPVGTRNTFKVIDAMRYLVRFMSDYEVEFESDLLENDLQLVITQGYSLRVDTIVSPMWEVSFSQLFDNIKKLRDIGFTIEYPTDTTTKPVLRLELKAYFFSETNSLIFNDPESIKTSVKTDEIYASIRAGSKIIADYVFLEYPESIRFNGFKEETFYPLGQCNLDAELSLVKDFACSSNDIEWILVDTDPTNDEELFLINVENIDDGAHTADAIGSNPFGATPPKFYNMALINSQILASYYGTIQGGLVAGFLNFTANDFQATKQIAVSNALTPGHLLVDPPIDINPNTYEAEVDPAGNFNLGTDFYTCPTTGFYTFNFRLRSTLLIGGQIGSELNLFIIDNLSATLAQLTVTQIPSNTQLIHTLTKSIYRTAGDQVGTRITLNYATGNAQQGQFRIDVGTVFSATSTPDTGGIVAEYDAADLRNILLEFDYPISATDFQTLLQNTRSKFQIALSVLNENYYGWIEQLNYNHKTSEAKIILKASINSIGGTLVNGELIYGYRFSFDMTDAADQIDSFTYNSGGSTTACAAIDLNDTIINITDLIEACLGASGITFDSVTVTKTQLVGALYSFIITIFNPSIDITIITISGTDYDSVVTYA